MWTGVTVDQKSMKDITSTVSNDKSHYSENHNKRTILWNVIVQLFLKNIILIMDTFNLIVWNTYDFGRQLFCGPSFSEILFNAEQNIID